MKMHTWRGLIVTSVSIAIVNMGLATAASAGIVGTADIVTSSRDADLSTIRAQLDRDDVRQQLQSLGVDAAMVDTRVANLSDSELRRMANDMQNAPAGGDFLAVLGIVFVVLLVLELVGVIDIFKKIP